MFGRASGASRLTSWLGRRAKKAGEIFAVEESLLAGRFGRYAARRLTAFGLGRGWAIALHVLELTWLAEVFSAKPFIASLALQNVTLVAEAMFFGALEGLRRRLRELGPTSDAAALATRWLTGALWLALAIVVFPLARYAWLATEHDEGPSLYHVYAVVCMLRLAVDVVARTYYSGVFAFHRVYRPLWAVFVAPSVVVGVTAILWKPLAGWAFPAGLAASAITSRAVLVLYARRAYRLRRVPPPRVRLKLAVRWEGGRVLRDSVLAALANTTTRLGGVVLLAAVVPSLTRASEGVFEDEAEAIEPFAFALHIAAPMLLLAAQWGVVFYHDWKRVEGDLSFAIGRALHRKLLVTALAVGVLAWLGACGLVLVWVPFAESETMLLALLPTTLGLSIWTALQLRGFARGEFVGQLASATAMLAVVWLTLSSTFTGEGAWYVALGGGAWVAIAVHALLAKTGAAATLGQVESVASWVRALEQARGDVCVWEARAPEHAARVTARIAGRIGEGGAVVRSGKRIVWFVRAREDAPHEEWLTLAGGMLTHLECLRGTGSALRAQLEQRGTLAAPTRDRASSLETLEALHGELFAEGFVLHVGRPPPRRFLALEPAVRHAIWRDGLRGVRGGSRGRSGWFVSAYAPEGAAEALFVAPRPLTPTQASAWDKGTVPSRWRIVDREPPAEAG